MKTTRSSSRPPRARHHRPNSSSQARSAPVEVKLLLVTFRSGEAVRQHPELQPWLKANWIIRSAMPRIVEDGATKLLVVLARPTAEVSSLGRQHRLPS